MKKIFKHLSIIFIFIILLFSTTSFATDTNDNIENSEKKSELNLYGKSCILIEKSTGRIAYEKNAEERMYPASTTKILTAILAVEKCNMSDVVTINNDMVSQVPPSYTTAYLTPGEKITVEQLLNCLLIPSANDAGFALAIHISGSVEAFSNLMNEKAREIGCQNSNFVNPSGIHNENHYSTAKDMALIGLYATRYPQIMDIVCKTNYDLQPSNSSSRSFYTTNTLLKPDSSTYYEYATGMKTGFTDPAGACIIASAKKDNMEFIAVVLNAPESDSNTNYRDLDCKTLFEYGFTNFDEITKIDPKIISFINNSFISGIKIDMVLKVGVALISAYLLFAIIYSKKKIKIECKN